MWDRRHIVELAASALRERARALDEETAVRGIDALTEVELQSVLAAGIANAGPGVFRELRLPATPRRGTRLAKDTERNRCDLVLTAAPALVPRDPMLGAREAESAKGTLFAEALRPASEAANPGGSAIPTGSVEPEDCFWLEVKVVGQFEFHAGVPVPNRSYTSVLVGGLKEDLKKLGAEERVRWGGAMMVVFASEERVATHDWAAALSRALSRGAPLRGEEHTGFPILERIGNAWCLVGMAWP